MDIQKLRKVLDDVSRCQDPDIETDCRNCILQSEFTLLVDVPSGTPMEHEAVKASVKQLELLIDPCPMLHEILENCEEVIDAKPTLTRYPG